MVVFVISEEAIAIPPAKKGGRPKGSRDSMKFNRRGRPRERKAAEAAADAIRRRLYSSIPEAAKDFFHQHIRANVRRQIQPMDRNRLKYFIRYIEEALRSGPKSMHVYAVLARRHIAQRRQAAFIKRSSQLRRRKIINELINVEACE